MHIQLGANKALNLDKLTYEICARCVNDRLLYVMLGLYQTVFIDECTFANLNFDLKL